MLLRGASDRCRCDQHPDRRRVPVPCRGQLPPGGLCRAAALYDRRGPALDARNNGASIIADERTVSRCWPQFHAVLVRDTPYRAVAAFPISAAGTVWATVDLYLTSDAALRRLPVPDAGSVADVIGSLLWAARGHLDTWFDAPVGAARQVTLAAVSLLAASGDMTMAESLTALRARAAAAGMTVDALADAVVGQRVPVDDVLPVRAPAPQFSAHTPDHTGSRTAYTEPHPPVRPRSSAV